MHVAAQSLCDSTFLESQFEKYWPCFGLQLPLSETNVNPSKLENIEKFWPKFKPFYRTLFIINYSFYGPVGWLVVIGSELDVGEEVMVSEIIIVVTILLMW